MKYRNQRALININSIEHKIDTKDFPCTISMLFRIEDYILNCDVQSRSTDVVTGLPYDIGFFSVVTELLAALITEDIYNIDKKMPKTNFVKWGIKNAK